MSFYQRYELERLIADGETKSFRAVENATGRRVLLHFFNPEGQPILAALKSKLGKVPGKPRSPLIELGEFAGSPYAVTETIQQFTTLRQWVDSIDGDAPPAADEVTMLFEAPKPRPPDDEVTVLFEALKPPPVADKVIRPFEAPKPSSVPDTQPGEFTRIFNDAPAPLKPRAPEAPKPQAPEPGEFTRWFDPPPAAPSKPALQAREFEELFGGTSGPAPSQITPPHASSKPSWPANPPDDAETGQFTRLFGSGPSGEAINIEEEQARAARAGQPESRPFQAPTEFTRVFGPEAGSNSPPPPPTRIDLASGIFGSIAELQPVAPTKAAGPGEYTRITSRAELEAELEVRDKAAQAAPAPAASRHGLVIVLAIGGALLVVALIAILVLSRKH